MATGRTIADALAGLQASSQKPRQSRPRPLSHRTPQPVSPWQRLRVPHLAQLFSHCGGIRVDRSRGLSLLLWQVGRPGRRAQQFSDKACRRLRLFFSVAEDYLIEGSRLVSLGVGPDSHKQTGKSMRADFAHVWIVDDGKIMKCLYVHGHREDSRGTCARRGHATSRVSPSVTRCLHGRGERELCQARH